MVANYADGSFSSIYLPQCWRSAWHAPLRRACCGSCPAHAAGTSATHWCAHAPHKRVIVREKPPIIYLNNPCTAWPAITASGCRRSAPAPVRASQSTKEQSAAPAKDDAGVRQMLGMKGAAEETDKWKIRVQLTKPVTWVPLIWGAHAAQHDMVPPMLPAWHCSCTTSRVAQSLCAVPILGTQPPPYRCRRRCCHAGVVCGAAASGKYVWNDPTDIAQLLTCCMMSGPFLTGYTQTINDYYDREIDAINEPYRPIPSGEEGSAQGHPVPAHALLLMLSMILVFVIIIIIIIINAMTLHNTTVFYTAAPFLQARSPRQRRSRSSSCCWARVLAHQRCWTPGPATSSPSCSC